MKVCIISDVFLPEVGGIQVFTFELARYLSNDERIEEVYVVTFSENVKYEKLSKNLSVIRLPKSNFINRATKLITKLIEKRNYDVFHSTTLGFSSFFTSYFSKFSNHRNFVTVYGLDVLKGYKTIKNRFMIRSTFSNVNKIIAFSESTRSKIKERYNPSNKKLVTIYPGISVPEISQDQVKYLRKKFSIEDNDFIVLFVGRLVKRKGADDLIHSVAMAKDEDIKLFIIGDGPERERLKELVRDLNVERQIIFAGEIYYRDIFKFYELASVFCMPSKYLRNEGDIEGLGIVFLEAQMYGVPVIGTNSGGIPEAIENGKSGFIVPENNPEAIREKILELKNNNELHRKMSVYATRFVQKKFNWKRCIDKHIKIYGKAI